MRTPNTKSAQHHPRKLLGFDLMKGLNELSQDRTGNRYTYSNCVVQRDGHGNIIAGINLDAMQIAQTRDALTYHQLVHRAIAEAEAVAQRVLEMPQGVRDSRLATLVKEAQTDGFKGWILSAICRRRLLFPNSYNGTRRCDNIRYRYNAQDGACGKVVKLESLRPSDVARFVGHAQVACPTVAASAITPIEVK